jgi:hypothetical protein
MKKATGRLLGLALALGAGQALAQTGNAMDGWHPFVSMGLTFGGDTIITVDYTNGDSEDVKAGEIVQFGAGVQLQLADSPLMVALSANYHVADAAAQNGKAEFVRYPLEAIAYYRSSDKWRFGLGLRYVLSPEASSDFSNEKLQFDNALGTVVEVGYAVSQHFWLNARIVNESYQPRTYTRNGASYNVGNLRSADGSHVGINALYAF